MIINKILPEQLTGPVKSENHEAKDNSFRKVLDEELKTTEYLNFSKHASERIEGRNIYLSQDDINKLSSAVKKAQDKGIKNSLVLMDDRAFIVNIKSRTVITAVDGQHLKENVFTNIDGAVIV
jgi:flagellar operon protein